MTPKTLRPAILLALSWIFAATANAGLLGSGVTANYYFPDLGTLLNSDSATVSPSIEWVDPTGYPGDFEAFDFIDIGDDFILFDFRADACCEWNNTSFNGFEFIFDAGVLADLNGVSFSPNVNGYVDSMLNVTSDTLVVDWRTAKITGVESVRINLEFPREIPAPATLLLVGAGLAGIGFRRRGGEGAGRAVWSLSSTRRQRTTTP